METIGFILLFIIGIALMIFGFGLAWLGSRFSSHTFTEIAVLFTIGCAGVLMLVYFYTHSPWVLVARGGV